MTVFTWLRGLWGRGHHRPAGHRLYQSAVAQARRPLFYETWQVPDTVDGRFDMLALHLFLLLERLRTEPQARPLSQTLVNIFVQDMDVNLREMGVGDLSVGKRVRKHAAALYGRLDAYRTAMESQDPEALPQALSRNVYRGDTGGIHPRATDMAAYARAQRTALASQDINALMRGEVIFQQL